jgi:ABC-type dipeptide/oligopeptide/nickel transport system ATPase subunit
MVGRHFQAAYHEEKKRDAEKVVRDGLQARRTAEVLMMTGHQNYHLPKPVLGQRKFANPMMGAAVFNSSRRDGSVSAPFITTERQMEGGVLSSFEGQQYYRNKLAERSAQLDRVNLLAQGNPVPRESVSQLYDRKKIGPRNKVEFFLNLRSLTDALIVGDLTRFTYDDIKEMLNHLFGFAPIASVEEMGEIMRAFDNLYMMLQDFLEENPDVRGITGGPGGQRAEDSERMRAYAETLLVLVDKAQNYLRQMTAAAGGNPQDRIALSQALINSDFARALIFDDERAALDVLARQNVRAAQRRENFDGGWDDDNGDGDVDDDDEGGDGVWSFRQMGREDAEQNGAPRAPFAGRAGDENRDRFGNRNGLYVYGESAFFGEGDGGGDGGGDMVVPLGLAGADPAATAVRTDPLSLKRAVESAIETILGPLGGFRAGMDEEEIEEFVRRQYPDTDVFVNEVVANLTDAGFTPPRIAKGMELSELPFFADYIAENTGEIDPAPAVPAFNWQNRFLAQQTREGAMGVRSPSERVLETETGEAAVGVAGAYPNEEQKADWFETTGIPNNRNEFLREFRSLDRLRGVAARMGHNGFLPIYRPRGNSNPKNVREEIIKRIKARIDPTY